MYFVLLKKKKELWEDQYFKLKKLFPCKLFLINVSFFEKKTL